MHLFIYYSFIFIHKGNKAIKEKMATYQKDKQPIKTFPAI